MDWDLIGLIIFSIILIVIFVVTMVIGLMKISGDASHQEEKDYQELMKKEQSEEGRESRSCDRMNGQPQ